MHSLREDLGPLHGAAASGDGKVLFLFGGKVAAAVDLETGKRRATFLGHREAILSLSAAGSLVATGGADGTLRLWDARSGECRKTLKPGLTPSSLHLSGDGRWLAAGFENGSVWIWQLGGQGPPRKALQGKGPVRCVRFLDAGARLLVLAGDGRVDLWDLARCARVGAFEAAGSRLACIDVSD
ncbi:MAG: hypothetical protein HY721_08180, partial [Planctomycetes bacterium]|nr:hypothetical protein [Planctomycetota bacterium]